MSRPDEYKPEEHKTPHGDEILDEVRKTALDIGAASMMAIAPGVSGVVPPADFSVDLENKIKQQDKLDEVQKED